MSDHERAVEASEIVTKLRRTSIAPLINALAESPECFTAGGRINCNAVARRLGIDPSAASRMLAQAREMTAAWS